MNGYQMKSRLDELSRELEKARERKATPGAVRALEQAIKDLEEMLTAKGTERDSR